MRPFQPRNTARARRLRNEATPAERMLWRHLSRSQLGVKFSRQMPVGPYFADFLCRELKLVVELDGYSHDLRAGYDATRDRWMADNGYQVMRIANHAVVQDLESVMLAVRVEVDRLRGCACADGESPPRCD